MRSDNKRQIFKKMIDVKDTEFIKVITDIRRSVNKVINIIDWLLEDE